MYSALDIARYIVWKENENGRPVSNLRLQKLLYFIQAQFIRVFGDACFSNRIEAWDFGPVVPSVYHKYKRFGSSCIPVENGDNLEFDCSTHEELIEATLNLCAHYNTSSLVSITHEQDPWKNAYKQFDSEITPEAIQDYYRRMDS